MASLLRTTGGGEPGFRWRGMEISRTENLSDAVFGFAITLLVVSTEVPRTFGELQDLLRGFVPFGVCVLLFGLIWKAHYTFFRRFGLEDGTTMVLNAALLFVVVFFLYPLKFLATLLFDLATGVPQEAASLQDADRLLVIYSAGYIAIFVLFALLYGHALRQREQLDLTDEEAATARLTRALFLVHVGVAAVSMTVALVWSTGGIAGGIYFLIGPLSYAMERRHARRTVGSGQGSGIAGR
jgi:uncharacterized membrane protein